MKYLHLFDNQTDYYNEKNKLILPSASLIENTKEVKYDRVHDYVEIAGIKWATMNVGAKSITDTGLYFQWGDTQGYTAEQVGKKEDGKKPFAYNWSDYKWYDNGASAFTKYNETSMTLALDDDAVHAAWGGSWRMPTTDEYKTLGDSVTTSDVTNYNNSGIWGLLCTDKNDTSKTLFFPGCGYADNGKVEDEDGYCYYWSNSLSSSNIREAYSFNTYNGDINWQDDYFGGSGRYYGFCVRGVWDDKINNSTL